MRRIARARCPRPQGPSRAHSRSQPPGAPFLPRRLLARVRCALAGFRCAKTAQGRSLHPSIQRISTAQATREPLIKSIDTALPPTEKKRRAASGAHASFSTPPQGGSDKRSEGLRYGHHSPLGWASSRNASSRFSVGGRPRQRHLIRDSLALAMAAGPWGRGHLALARADRRVCLKPPSNQCALRRMRGQDALAPRARRWPTAARSLPAQRFLPRRPLARVRCALADFRCAKTAQGRSLHPSIQRISTAQATREPLIRSIDTALPPTGKKRRAASGAHASFSTPPQGGSDKRSEGLRYGHHSPLGWASSRNASSRFSVGG